MMTLGHECHCSDPLIRCDMLGCRCVMCGGHERSDLPTEVTHEELGSPTDQSCGVTVVPVVRSPVSGTDLVTDQLRYSGSVLRYHTWPTIVKQTVGEHCWQLARVYETVFGPPRAEVERAIRHHDSAELATGDPPFPVKARNPALKAEYTRLEGDAERALGIEMPDLSVDERLRLKVSDLLEMMEFGMKEREMGNLLAAPIVTRAERAAVDLADERLPGRDSASVRAYVRRCWLRHEIVLANGDVSHGYRYETRGDCV